MAKAIDVNNDDFGGFLRFYKKVYANLHIEDYDSVNAIISIVEAPYKYQKEYSEYQLVKYQDKYQESEGK